MSEPNPERLADVESKIQTGFRVHARGERRTRSIQLADELSKIHDQLDEAQLPTVDETTNTKTFFSGVDRNLQRTRKTIEVVEDSLQIGLGHSKLARLAMTGAQLNSGVALVTAAHNLLMSATQLDRAHASVSSIQNITAERFHDFYRALGLFVLESILFATPINYQIAWRGTRYLNNHSLYALRHNGFSGSIDSLLKSLHRLILSEIHYAFRGIVPASLRTPEEFVTYLTSMATQTLAILQEFSDISIRQMRSKAEEVVNEYYEFAENTYEVATADVDLTSVIQDTIRQFSDDVSLFSIPASNHRPRL